MELHGAVLKAVANLVNVSVTYTSGFFASSVFFIIISPRYNRCLV